MGFTVVWLGMFLVLRRETQGARDQPAGVVEQPLFHTDIAQPGEVKRVFVLGVGERDRLLRADGRNEEREEERSASEHAAMVHHTDSVDRSKSNRIQRLALPQSAMERPRRSLPQSNASL